MVWYSATAAFLIAATAVGGVQTPTFLTQQDPAPPDSLLKEAQRYYEATLFDRAIPVLQDLLKTLHANTEERAWALLRLAQCYYYSNRYSKIPETLSEINSQGFNPNQKIHDYNAESLFLLGLSYNKIKKHDQAGTALLRFLSLEGQRPSPFHFDVLYELGMAYFHQKKFKDAKQHLSSIPSDVPKNGLFFRSQVSLARIAIAEGNSYRAKQLINQISETALDEEGGNYVLAFLQGEMAFNNGNWNEARMFFREASPEKNMKHAGWSEDVLYLLGWSCLNLTEETKPSAPELSTYLAESEKAFQKLVEVFPSDKAYLGLGQCYLSQGRLLGSKESLEKLEALLSDKERFTSRESLHLALLLRAEASPSYSERTKFFRQLTGERNQNSPNYANAWYLRGLNEFDHGQELLSESQSEEARKFFESAIGILDRSFELLYPLDKKLAASCLKYQIQSYYYLNTREGFLKGLSLMGKLLNQYRDELFEQIDDPEEIYFLQGLIAGRLIEGDEGQTFFSIATSSLVHAIDSYPNSEFYDESLRLLATLYYQKEQYGKAEEVYLRLAGMTPPSPFSAEAFFWAANCSQLCDEDPKRTKHFRKKVFEQFPGSPLAAEAYFRYFDYSEYLRGYPEAKEHLEALMVRFPDSPFCLNALYLLGLNKLQERKGADGKITQGKDPDAAIEAFSRLETLFDDLHSKEKIPEDRIGYFAAIRYRAILERAAAHLRLVEDNENPKYGYHIENAEAALHQMYADFETPGHPLTRYLIHGESLASIQEECAYQLARCYIRAGNDEAAERLLSRMQEKYQRVKVTRGYYLSKVLFESGNIAARRQDFAQALAYYKSAEDAAKGKVLRADELLDLWIAQSQSNRNMGQVAEAMLILSNVINYDAVSPKRLEAMYLRAEIYKDEGRHELAKRQLEAIAKKGGKWAMEAKSKLEETYGYQ